MIGPPKNVEEYIGPTEMYPELPIRRLKTAVSLWAPLEACCNQTTLGSACHSALMEMLDILPRIFVDQQY